MELAPRLPRVPNVFALMAADHHRLDRWLAAAIDAAGRESWDEVPAPLGAFLLALATEIAVEENFIFPAFERLSGHDAVTAKLRTEHSAMRWAAVEMQAAAQAHDLAALRDAHDRLMNVLTYHELKEERGVFAELDRWLSDADREALVAELDRWMARPLPWW